VLLTKSMQPWVLAIVITRDQNGEPAVGEECFDRVYAYGDCLAAVES